MLDPSVLWKLLGTFISSTECYVVFMYYFLVFVSSHFFCNYIAYNCLVLACPKYTV
jgi:hypothetical protein